MSVSSADKLMVNRRSFLTRFRNLMLPLTLVGGGSYVYGSELERHRLKIEKYDVKLSLGLNGPSKLRIVSLTDFHFDPLYEIDFITKCVDQTNALSPDLVLLTGDYVTHSSRRIDELSTELARLTPKVSVLACMGNHDYISGTPQVLHSMQKQGINTLVNQHSRFNCGDGELIVAGLQTASIGIPKWTTAANGIGPSERALVLMHEPDSVIALCRDSRVAMQFSGHTHGGQVRIPGYGALILPPLGRQYQAGLYDVRKMKLHVNRGIGTIGYHVRFLCPPEIACFDITNVDKTSLV